MSPIEASIPQFNLAHPPPGFYHNPAPRGGGSSPPSPTEQDPMLIHHLANVSRAKLNSLFRSRKDSGLLKHVLIQNLSRSYEDLAPELVTEEREDGYDEIVVQRRTAEEMWLDACLQDLDDDNDDDDDDEDGAMYTARLFYAASSSEEDLAMATPALSPDMSTMDDSDLDFEDFEGKALFAATKYREVEILKCRLFEAQGYY